MTDSEQVKELGGWDALLSAFRRAVLGRFSFLGPLGYVFSEPRDSKVRARSECCVIDWLYVDDEVLLMSIRPRPWFRVVYPFGPVYVDEVAACFDLPMALRIRSRLDIYRGISLADVELAIEDYAEATHLYLLPILRGDFQGWPRRHRLKPARASLRGARSR